jgi:hypothetical protein
MAMILMIQTSSQARPLEGQVLVTSAFFGNLGGDGTPRQDSLPGVIICPSKLQIFGWAAVKGELLHRNTLFL